jgi:predicted PurR-regulated permease PerM
MEQRRQTRIGARIARLLGREEKPEHERAAPLLLTPAPIQAPRVSTLAVIAGVVVILAVARDVIIPLALAVFIAMLLQPLVARLERLGVGHVLSVVAVSILALLPVIGVGWLVFDQFVHVATTLPQYTDNIREKIVGIQGPAGQAFTRVTDMLSELRGEAVAAETGGVQPVPVSVVEPEPDALSTLTAYAGGLFPPLATIGIMLVFAVFILLQWDDLRDRMIRLISSGRMTTTTAALDELSQRIGRYLRMQFMVNAMNGVGIGVGLAVIGVPNALLWGFLNGALRYIPYIGGITAGVLPLALSVATSEGWQQPLIVLLYLITFELVTNNFVEPYMYGSSTGISEMALLLAAVFWGWLWGIPGLLLATPLTVCLVVAGRHVPQLTFLNVLLGDTPVLPPQQKFYQRLIAMDGEEATEVAMDYLEEHSLVELYDEVVLPALRNADCELEDGTLDRAHYEFILQIASEVVEDAALRAGELVLSREEERENGKLTPPRLPVPEERLRLLCVPARDEADAIAGQMVEMLGSGLGVGVRAMGVDELGNDLAAVVAEYKPDLVLISSVPPHAATHARARAKIARRRVAGLQYVAGTWGVGREAALRPRLEASGFAAIVGSMEEAVRYLKDAVPKVSRADPAVDRAVPGRVAGAVERAEPPLPGTPRRAETEP